MKKKRVETFRNIRYVASPDRNISHSTVYRDCHGLSSIIAIHKDILVYTFSFNLNLSFKDIKVKNM